MMPSSDSFNLIRITRIFRGGRKLSCISIEENWIVRRTRISIPLTSLADELKRKLSKPLIEKVSLGFKHFDKNINIKIF